MSDRQLEKNVRQNAAKVKKDLSTLAENRVSQLSKEFDRLTGDAKETVVSTANAVKKDVGQRLSQYNAKAQKIAKKVPDNFANKAARYSWVLIPILVVVGLVVGFVMRPSHQPVA